MYIRQGSEEMTLLLQNSSPLSFSIALTGCLAEMLNLHQLGKCKGCVELKQQPAMTTLSIFFSRKQRHYKTAILYYFWYRRFHCFSWQIGRDKSLEDDTKNNQLIYYVESPNYNQGNGLYPSRRLSYYHLRCPSHTNILASNFSLQGPVTVLRDGRPLSFCVDYVNITGLDGNTPPYFSCGSHQISRLEHLETFNREVVVTFRSSKYNNALGFRLIAVCMNVSEQDQPGCLQMENLATTTKRNQRSYWEYAYQEEDDYTQVS